MIPPIDYRLGVLEQLSRQRRRMGRDCPHRFAAVYLAHHFSVPPSRMHEELFAALGEASERRHRRLAYAAPRGHAKTTLVSLAYVLWSVLYRREMFVLMVSATREQAIQLLADIKKELTGNELILRDFPDACHRPGEAPPKPWKINQITLKSGPAVRVLGAGQGLRGMKHRQHRPTLIIGDDLEELEATRSPEQRQKLREWFFQTLLQAGGPGTNVIVVGTILHYDALLAHLVGAGPARGPRQSAWEGGLYRAVEAFSDRPDLWQRWEGIRCGEQSYQDRQGIEASHQFYLDHEEAMLEGTRVLWPQREDYERLMEIRADEGYAAFQCEKQNEPLDPHQCLFSARSIRYWDDDFSDTAELIASLGGRKRFYGACDPSLGKRVDRGDYTAIITLVQDTDTNVMYVIGAEILRRRPDAIIEHIIQLAITYNFAEFAVEANQFQEVLADQLHNRARAKGVSLALKKATNTGNKQARIEALEPLVAQGQVRFSRRHQLLLDQLRQFPLGAHDDGPDALEMAVAAAHRRRYTTRVIQM